MQANELTPSLYGQLLRLAHARARRVPHLLGYTMQPTALAHEAYIRLADRSGWESRGHFLGMAACAMRDIAVERARARKRLKRGGTRVRVMLPDDKSSVWADDVGQMAPEDSLALGRVLALLEDTLPENAELVRLRYGVGLTLQQIAELYGESKSTVERRWRFTRAWLRTHLAETGCNISRAG